MKKQLPTLVAAAAVWAVVALAPSPASAQPDGTMLTLGWETQKLFTVDPSDASTAEVGTSGVTGSTGIVWDETTDTLFAMSYDLDPDELYTVDPDTGASTLVGSLGLDDPTGMEIQPGTGTLFITYDAAGGSILATVDKASAAVTDVGPTLDGQVGVRIGAMAFHPDTGVLYALSYGEDLYELDPTTGALTLLFSNLPDVSGAFGLTFDCAGTLFGAQDDLVTIDPATGDVTVVGQLGLVASDGDFVENLTVICNQTPPTTTTEATTTTTSEATTTTSTTSTTAPPAEPGAAQAARATVAQPTFTG